MKTIYTINSKKTMAFPGVWGYDAEAMVASPDSPEEVFVHVNNYDGMRSYTVAASSMMGGDVPDFTEEYGKLDEAKESQYYGVFKALNAVIAAMKKEVG